MGHKTGFLSGSEPEEKVEKTEAQKNDERLPEAMKQSKIIAARYGDSDELPAIEQVFEHNEVQAPKRTGKTFDIDEGFENEMHTRSQAEHEAREKARKQREQAEKQAAEKKAAEVAEKMQHAQSLDPEEINNKNIDQERAENAEKLYPDPISMQDEVEEELWRKRADKGDQIAKRAKLVEVYDDKLHRGIVRSLTFQILGTALAIIPTFTVGIFPQAIERLLMVGSAVGFIYGFITLRQAAAKYRSKHLPDDQEPTFVLASVMPFMALRFVLIDIFKTVLGVIPYVGGYLGIAAGVMVGSSLSYQYFCILCFLHPPIHNHHN